MPDFADLHLVTALLERNYYVLSVAALMILIQVGKTKLPEYWEKIPVGFRFLPAVLVAMANGFIHGFAMGETWQLALTDALNAIWQVAIPAMGGAAALKESHLPWDGGAGGVKPLPEPAYAPLSLVIPRASVLPEDLLSPDDRPTPVDPYSVPRPPTDPPEAA